MFGSLIVVFGLLLLYLALKRYFNYDEYNVIYKSSTFKRSQHLYSDLGYSHLPLTNILTSFCIALFDVGAHQLIIGRIVIFMFLLSALYFCYKISTVSASETVGMAAILMLLSSFAFVQKGIEIRHDVYNMMFNTAGVLFLLYYLKAGKLKNLFLSALLCGCALASTQKSIIWIAGIVTGLFLYFALSGEVKKAVRLSAMYSAVILLPLVVVLSGFVIAGDSVSLIVRNTIIGKFGYLFPGIGQVSSGIPFPHSKWRIWSILFDHNSLLFISLIPALAVFWMRFKRKPEIVLFTWCVFGVLFYLVMKRPFYQSLLPTMPAIAIISAYFVRYLSRHIVLYFGKRRFRVFAALVCSITFGPAWYLFSNSYTVFAEEAGSNGGARNTGQLETAAFCSSVLSFDDKVFCFSHQQLFYDPLYTFFKKNNGLVYTQIPPDVMKKDIFRHECRVMIYDSRTQSLSREVRALLNELYVYSGIGVVFIPGREVPPKKTVTYEVFVPGEYFVEGGLLQVGEDAVEDTIVLDKGVYELANPGENTVILKKNFTMKR